nr:hypothetical protein [Tanacetum cinerariifolium]
PAHHGAPRPAAGQPGGRLRGRRVLPAARQPARGPRPGRAGAGGVWGKHYSYQPALPAGGLRCERPAGLGSGGHPAELSL